MDNKVLVAGTIAFDILFPVDGDMRREITVEEGEVRTLNMTFLARRSEYYYGGTAGNISYGLAVLKEKPILFSVVGADFDDDYRTYLEKIGVICRPVVGPIKSETARAFVLSDDLNQQVQIFQGNHYSDKIDEISLLDTLSRSDLSDFKIAIFSAFTPVSSLNLIREFRRFNKDARLIFDPGVNIPLYTKKQLVEGISHSDILIVNDVEFRQLQRLHSLDTDHIFQIGVSSIVVTEGNKGSFLYTPKSRKKISLVKPKRVVETTGAGDAYRAGLIKGLLKGKTVENACKLGSKMASKSVEVYSGQGYRI